MTDFPFDASGCCPACGDPEEDGVLCAVCCDMVRHDPRTSFQLGGTTGRICASCGEPADSLGWCQNMRELMECWPKRWDDVQFLRDCGIQPIAI